MNEKMREYLARTANADKARNKRILAECRESLIKHEVFATKAAKAKGRS